MQNMEARCRKAYVCVNLDVDKEGAIRPRFIRWDNGLIFQIDQILYTVMIKGKESFLFHEGDKWFVEAKENAQ